MPNREPSRATGLLNPTEGLSFSAAVLPQPLLEATVLSGGTSRANLAPSIAPLQLNQEQDENQTNDGQGAIVLADEANGEDGSEDADAETADDADGEEEAEGGDAEDEDIIDTSLCEEIDSSLYCVYTIQAGDTLAGIAQKFNLQGNDQVTPWELLVLSNRPDVVSEDDILQPGQKLRIPRSASVVADLAGAAGNEGAAVSGGGASFIHTVLRTETVSDIAERYGVEIAEIIAVNGLADPDSLQIGQELLIPNPQRLDAPAVASADEPAADESDTDSTAAAPPAPATGATSAAGFMWPTTGPISSYYGPGHPLGIDIDLFANPNAPVVAAADGVVTFAGGNPCCSYGYYVVVDHGNGFSTLYAHFSAIYVSVGEYVSQGQVLGAGGRTGYATGNHLHFEVHRNGAIVNPTDYLP